MIDWPAHMENDGEEGAALSRFKESSLAAELEDDPRAWTFLAWARKPDPPARMVLRSDGGELATFTRQKTGLWVREH